MKINLLDSESRLLGGNVLQIKEFESASDIIDNELAIINKFKPAYIYCTVNAINIETIQKLEASGFSFSEFRVHSHIHLKDTEVSTKSFFPYTANLIGQEEDLERCVKILLENLPDDRFSNDPEIGRPFSQNRMVENLSKSFRSYPKEFLLGLFNSQTDELLAFRSGGFETNTEAIYYLSAVSGKYDHSHYSDMMEAFTIDFLKNKGVEIIHVVSTGFNITELNRLLKSYDFRITQTEVVLRKLYR